jgi:phage terminase large subunit-like protein
VPNPSQALAAGGVSAAEQYIAGVLGGSIVAGLHVRRAVSRHVRDLEKSRERGAAFYFDREEAQFAIDCFGFFRHSKGKWAGTPFVLSPWQQFIVWSIFGWKRRRDRLRRFRRVYIEIARKNGKSTFLAGLLIILFALDMEQGAEVYSAATKKDQARIVFNEAKRMVKKSPELRTFIQAHRNNLDIPATESKFEPLSADANSLDGLNVHGAGVDELHAHKTREVWDVLDTATGSREQPLIAAITTAGFNQEGICYELRAYCIEVLDPNLPVEDDEWFAFIASIDDDDDWQDENCWAKANPNLSVSCFLDDLRAKARRARRNAAALNNFLCKHLDRWTQQAERWLQVEDWDLLARAIDLSKLEDCDCYGGLDLSEKCDLNAFAMIFPPRSPGDPTIVLFRFWVPEAVVEKRGEEGDWKYDAWVKAGLLEATPGEVADYDIIRDDIIELGRHFHIRQISFDPWNALHLSTQLTAAGFEMVEVPQTHRYMNETAKDFEAQILGGKLAHNGDQLARWMVDNVAVLMDREGRIRPVKPRDRRKKIDGVVAALLANRSRLSAPPDTYDSPEVIMV